MCFLIKYTVKIINSLCLFKLPIMNFIHFKNDYSCNFYYLGGMCHWMKEITNVSVLKTSQTSNAAKVDFFIYSFPSSPLRHVHPQFETVNSSFVNIWKEYLF